MVTLKFSLCAVLLFFSIGCSSQSSGLQFNNTIKGCFTAKSWTLEINEELTTARISIAEPNLDSDCPCKSAIVSFRSYQDVDIGVNSLLSGNFTTFEKETVVLPIAVQKQLIFSNLPVKVNFSCAGT